jgi:hypothetical protein
VQEQSCGGETANLLELRTMQHYAMIRKWGILPLFHDHDSSWCDKTLSKFEEQMFFVFDLEYRFFRRRRISQGIETLFHLSCVRWWVYHTRLSNRMKYDT